MSKPRRQRFHFTATDRQGVRGDVPVLAYSEANAFAVLMEHGYTGVVQKGKPLATGARADMLAVRRAAADLGIDCPIEVKYHGRDGSVRGYHQITWTPRKGWVHVILLKSYLTREQMGQTLWHELAHAMQFERDVLRRYPDLTPEAAKRRWGRSYRDGTTYARKPYEVEARAYESRQATQPITR